MNGPIYTAALSKIAEFFQDHDSIEHATLESLHADSFILIQIMLALETTFNIEFDDAMLELSAFQTIHDLASYVEEKISNGSSKTYSI